ncbi:hypothetical protein JCM11251_006297 [Rhodosporidiobolus azoricus]
MAPHAHLTFTPTAFPSSAADVPALRPPLKASHKPLPSHAPSVDVTGAFSLLPEGGIVVGEMVVKVERGTGVERGAEREATQADERATRSLWWRGRDTAGEEGRWELFLLNRPPRLHRILLFLPPSAPDPLPLPAFPSTAGEPAYRNSLILFDEGSRSVIGVIPLSPTDQSPMVEESTPVPHVHPPEPSPSYHPPAADFARYIDHVANSLHPSPTAEPLRNQREMEAEERERKAKKEEESEELPFPLPFLDYTVRPSFEGRAMVDDDEGEQSSRMVHGQRRVKKGMERLDLEMELACEHKPSKVHPNPPPTPSLPSTLPSHIESRQPWASRPASTWTVSSFATFGTEKFVTADEGNGSERSSIAPMLRGAPSDSGQEGENGTPRPTIPLPATSMEPSSIRRPSLLKSPSPALLSASPSATFTNENAVLLSFLNTPTVLLPSLPASAAPAHKVSVSAHPLSAEKVSEMSERREIRAMEVISTSVTASASEGGRGWLDWLLTLPFLPSSFRQLTDCLPNPSTEIAPSSVW